MDQKGKCIFALCVLNRSSNTIFINLNLPKEIYYLIIYILYDINPTNKTIDGFKPRLDGIIYKKIPYTIYHGNCITSDDHEKYKCICELGEFDDYDSYDSIPYISYVHYDYNIYYIFIENGLIDWIHLHIYLNCNFNDDIKKIIKT